MIVYYIPAIVVVCGLIAFYFWWRVRKRKKALKGLLSPKSEKPKEDKKEARREKREKKKIAQQELERDLKAAEKEVVKEEKKIAAELEDFVWDDSPKSPVDEEESLQTQDKKSSQQGGIDDNLFESRLEDYESYLREEAENFDNENLSEEDQNDIDALMNFDFDKLKGKSRAEVAEMIKDLSPAVQDFILNDILERKNGEG